jgi:hypothetical protein
MPNDFHVPLRHRQHSSLVYQTPVEYAEQFATGITIVEDERVLQYGLGASAEATEN